MTVVVRRFKIVADNEVTSDADVRMLMRMCDRYGMRLIEIEKILALELGGVFYAEDGAFSVRRTF